MCSWKVLLLLACTASLIVNCASDDVPVDADVQDTVEIKAIEGIGEPATIGISGEIEATVTGDTTATSDSCSCAPRCKKNEVYTDCKDRGCTPYSCSELGFPLKCDSNCKPGCICKDSLLRAENGTCIPREQCPSCGGDENAGPGCGSYCINCANYEKKPVACPLSCILNGCQCKDGYIYDRNVKKCVLPKQCTPTCGSDEVYNACTNGGCDARYCSQVGEPVPCVKLDPESCIKGCVCRDGYLRASNGTCVPKNQCEGPPKCNKPNEVYDVCPAPCPPRRCDVDDRLIKCAAPPKPGDAACKPGCRCADGYVRNADNVCIPKNKCPPKCEANEVYSSCINGGCDARNCSQLGKPGLCIDPIKCIEGCVCAKGYLRNSKGKCVPTDQCGPDICPGQNEYFDTCIKGCSNQSCDSIGKLYSCPIQTTVCRTGCRCNPGFYRNSDNVCVAQSQCPPPTCPEGETYNKCPTVKCDGDYCPKTRDSPQTCPVGIVCDPPRCTCGFNQKRDRKTGKCIATRDCPPFACNGANEEYQPCPYFCPGENCSDYINNSKCPKGKIGTVLICNPQCKCKKGYFRNKDGVCVIGSKCAPKCGANEVYSSCINGGCDARNCSQLGKPGLCIDPIKCTEGCVCAKGYLRNSKGKCVPTDQCGPDICPGQNEYFDTCIKGCSNQSCDSIGKIFNCPIQTTVCRTGCRCNPGFYRNSNNVCVAQSQCPPPTCPEGETYNKCPTVKCDGDYCPKTRDSPQTCPVGIVCDPPRCTCGFNQKRDRKTGKCIATRDCPPFACNGANEEYQPCPYFCPGENCSDYINNSKCPPGKIGTVLICNPQCKCKKGYFRNKDGVCIIGSKCAPTCGSNEVYNACTNGGCDARNCSQVGKPVPCVKLDPKSCIEGCVCKDGFLRASNGTCVPKNQCEGPPKCNKPNEVYDVCPAPCPPRRCDVDDRLIKCAAPPKPGDAACKPGCRCADGYARNATGTCVLRCQCEKPLKCKANEVYDSCPAVCPPQKCGIDPALILCLPNPNYGDPTCQPGCKCIDDYVRNADNVCIPKNKCPPKCGSNEVYSSCINDGCDARNCSQLGKPVPYCARPVKCIEGCVCAKGYLRNSNGKCVPTNQCGSSEHY